MGHLSQAQLFNLVEGMEGSADAFTSLLHLKRCPPCRARLITEYPTDGPALVHEFNLDNPRQTLPPVAANAPLWAVEEEPDAENRQCLESWASGSEAIAEELLVAPALARELEGIDPARQRLALEARQFHTFGFAAYLLTCSIEFWHERPTEARRLAELTLVVVSKLDPTAYPLGYTTDLRCKAVAYVGNSLRLMGRLREAEAKLTEALAWWERGSGDLCLRARLLELFAQLHRDQRLFMQALAKANEAMELYRGMGDRSRLATLVLIRASILGEKGEAATAIEALQDLLNSVPRPVLGEEIYWSARQNLCHRLVEADRLWEARRELYSVRRWAHRAPKPLITVRVLWVEALLVAREGDFAGATVRLEQVRDAFLRNGLPYDAALACLDLAAFYLERGLLEEAQGLAGVVGSVFQVSGIHREALAGLRLVVRALEKKAATATQVKLVQHQLTRQRRRVKHD